MGDGGPATAAQISNIQGIAVDRWGNLYLSDTDNHRVRMISTSGVITTLAGTGAAGFSGDGGPATAAQLNLPYGLAADLAGYVYVADLGNDRVRRIGPDGVITTVAGNGNRGSSGDGGAATSAQLLTPRNVAVDAAGNLYFSEFEGHRVRKVTPDGRISTVAGTGVAGFRGDGGSAVNAQLAFPAGLAGDRLGALYIAD
jgi:sugar lactone lactonase YvrE